MNEAVQAGKARHRHLHQERHQSRKAMKRFLLSAVIALAIAATAGAQATIFPATATAPAEYNTGTVHISILSRSEHQLTATMPLIFRK